MQHYAKIFVQTFLCSEETTSQLIPADFEVLLIERLDYIVFRKGQVEY